MSSHSAGDMDGWIVPEAEPCRYCGGTEDTGHTKRCDDWIASLMAAEA